MSFLLNTRSRTVHRSDSTDKRCQLRRLNPENAMEFSSPEAALSYFTEIAPARLCPFCLAACKKGPTRMNRSPSGLVVSEKSNYNSSR